MDTIYTETTGTTCHLAGQRGTVTGLEHTLGTNRKVVGAFVCLDGPVDVEGNFIGPGHMLHVALGKPVGDRGQSHEVTGWSFITRDFFDTITGLAAARTEMGWRS